MCNVFKVFAWRWRIYLTQKDVSSLCLWICCGSLRRIGKLHGLFWLQKLRRFLHLNLAVTKLRRVWFRPWNLSWRTNYAWLMTRNPLLTTPLDLFKCFWHILFVGSQIGWTSYVVRSYGRRLRRFLLFMLMFSTGRLGWFRFPCFYFWPKTVNLLQVTSKNLIFMVIENHILLDLFRIQILSWRLLWIDA